jgi:hypothetical protein
MQCRQSSRDTSIPNLQEGCAQAIAAFRATIAEHAPSSDSSFFSHCCAREQRLTVGIVEAVHCRKFQSSNQ